MEPAQAAALPTVAVIGASLVLEGIATRLADNPELSVTYAALGTTDTDDWLSSTWPAIVIFELDSLHAHRLLERIASPQPPILIGLDFSNNRVVVSDGQEYIAPSIHDLCSIVLEAIRYRGHLERG